MSNGGNHELAGSMFGLPGDRCSAQIARSMPEERGRTRKPRRVDVEKVAIRSRLKNDLKALASKTAGGAGTVCRLDPSELLKRSLRSFEPASRALDLSSANKVHEFVVRVVTKPTVGKGATLKLDVRGVEASRRVLTDVTRALSSSFGSKRRNAGAQTRNFMKRCVGTLCQFCEMCENPLAWKYALEYVRDAAEVEGMPFEELFSEQDLGPSYQQMEAGYIAAIDWSLQEVDTLALTELARLYRRHEALEEKVTSHLRYVLSERASTLPSSSQKWITDQLGLAPQQRDFEYADPSDSPEIREAAALLLYLFDQQTLSDQFKEAFARFRGLCEAHFHLFLRGKIGEVIRFDSRLHEAPDSNVGELRLIRPWVEWFLPPDARVIIRGIVQPKA